MHTRRFVLAVVLLGAVAAIVSVVSLELIHDSLSWNRDEPVYLWHTQVLGSGRLTAPLGSPAEAFQPWLSGADEAGYFSQYTIGWPGLLLVADTVTGHPAGAVVLGAVLYTVGACLVARELTGRRRVAVCVGALATLSPVIVIQSGLHLSYLFTTGVGMLALTAGRAGCRSGRRLLLVVAGALLGLVLLTRPFDAVVWGAMLVAGVLLRSEAPWRRRAQNLVGLWPAVAVGLPAAVFTLWYNRRISGEPLTFPIVATDPLDTFGFGRRRLMPGFRTVDYGLGTALHSTLKNSAFFGLFLAGNAVTAALAFAGSWWRRRDPVTWTLWAMAAAFPLGYFAFFGIHISSLTARLVGSIYYVPSVVPVCVLAVLGLRELHRRNRRMSGMAVALAVLLTVPVMVSRLDVNRRISEAQEPWFSSVEHIDGPALVIVADSGPYLMYKNPAARNTPDLDGELLYALDLGPKNFETIRANPDRAPFLQISAASADELGARETPIVPQIELIPMSIVEGERISIRAEYLPPLDAPIVTPFLEVDGEVAWQDVASVEVAADRTVTATFVVDATDGALPSGGSKLRVGFGAGDAESSARRHPRIRWELPVQVEAAGMRVLLPAQESQLFLVGPLLKWLPRLSTPPDGFGVVAER